jgi:hypothetical protein
MKRMLLAAIACVMALPALAQDRSHTTCTRSGDDLDCRTTTQRQHQEDPYWSSYQAARENSRRQEAEMLRQMVGRAIADGKCEKARALALRGGDLELAESAQRLCRPAP